MTEKTLHIVAGPTAVGKTDFAIALAENLKCEIISADSRQIYKEMNIGTARPDDEQLSRVKHHMIANISIHDDYNTGQFIQDARTLINELFQTQNNIVVCGGTGLYLNSLLQGLDALPAKNEARRKELEDLYSVNGVDHLSELLKNLSPEKHANIDTRNPQRLIRAIEIAENQTPQNQVVQDFSHDFHVRFNLLEMERNSLYERINRRVELMIDRGLELEARELYPYRNLNALQTVGYSEWWPFFESNMDKSEVIDKIKQHTRNYAKRQLTWFRNKTPRQIDSSHILSVHQNTLVMK